MFIIGKTLNRDSMTNIYGIPVFVFGLTNNVIFGW